MTETLPAVTAAREALAAWEGTGIDSAWALRRVTALADALEDLLAVVDRLTAPVAREDVDAALDALDEQYGTITMTEIRHLVGPLRTFVSTAIVAASGRRHLPTEPDEREWGLISPDAHPGQYGRDDRAHLVSRNREHVERQHRRGHPSIMLAHRRAPGPWEVCDEQ